MQAASFHACLAWHALSIVPRTPPPSPRACTHRPPPSPPSLPAPQVNFGQALVLVGSAEQLGSWQLEHAPTMTWGEGDVWTASLELPAGANIEYKFALTDPHQ